MVPLPVFPHPLPQNQPPTGYALSDRPLVIATLKTRTAFKTGIDSRDQFRGTCRCIVCGVDSALQHCHIIGQAEDHIWADRKRRHWTPAQARHSQRLDPRNGILMCATHRMFDTHKFFIRYMPLTQRFVLINFSGNTHLQQFHGKAVGLDVHDALSPFPSLFIIHEMRTLGYHPFQPTSPDVSAQGPWQDWVLANDIFDDISETLIRT